MGSNTAPDIKFLEEQLSTSLPDGFRVLTPQEIATVEPVFLERGAVLPNPAVSTFVGAVENGEVLCFLVLQVKLHAEPMWIKEGRSDLITPLVKKAEETILERVGPQWVYLFTPAGRVTQLAVALGCGVEPWVVCSKFVQRDTPAQPTVNLMPEDTVATEVQPEVVDDTGGTIQ